MSTENPSPLPTPPPRFHEIAIRADPKVKGGPILDLFPSAGGCETHEGQESFA